MARHPFILSALAVHKDSTVPPSNADHAKIDPNSTNKARLFPTPQIQRGKKTERRLIKKRINKKT